MKTVIKDLLAEYDMSDSAFAKDLREALAEQPDHHDPIGDAQDKLIAEQAAQAQQEPVAWAMYQKGQLLSFWIEKGDAYDFEFTSEHSWVPLYTTPQAPKEENT